MEGGGGPQEVRQAEEGGCCPLDDRQAGEGVSGPKEVVSKLQKDVLPKRGVFTEEEWKGHVQKIP